MQQGLASAHTALMSDERPIDLKPWLYRIVHNGALNVLRGERDVVTLDEHEGDQLVPGVEAQVEERERFRSVIGAVQALPTAQRDALLLRELEGRSHEEIASALGVTAGAARQHLMRARATMRAAVTAVTPYPLALKLAALGAGAGAAGLPAAGALTGAGAGFSLSKLGAGVLAAGALAGGAGVVVPAIVPGPRIARIESKERARPAVTPASGARVSSTTPAVGGAASRTLSSATGDVGRKARDGATHPGRQEDDSGEREGRSDREGAGPGERRAPGTTSPSRREGRHGGASQPGDDHADDDRHERLSGSRQGSSGSDSSGPGSDSGSSGSGSSGSGSGSSGSGSGSSGSGSSGSGSGSSGSGSSGSGDSGRGGSGTSGSRGGDLSSGSSSGSGSSGSRSGSREDPDDRSGSGDASP